MDGLPRQRMAAQRHRDGTEQDQDPEAERERRQHGGGRRVFTRSSVTPCSWPREGLRLRTEMKHTLNFPAPGV